MEMPYHLLFVRGDFHHGITLAGMGAWDTDCNGATVGPIAGAITGGKNVPAHWAARLIDTLRSEIIGCHPIPVSECAKQTLDVVRAIRM